MALHPAAAISAHCCRRLGSCSGLVCLRRPVRPQTDRRCNGRPGRSKSLGCGGPWPCLLLCWRAKASCGVSAAGSDIAPYSSTRLRPSSTCSITYWPLQPVFLRSHGWRAGQPHLRYWGFVQQVFSTFLFNIAPVCADFFAALVMLATVEWHLVAALFAFVLLAATTLADSAIVACPGTASMPIVPPKSGANWSMCSPIFGWSGHSRRAHASAAASSASCGRGNCASRQPALCRAHACAARSRPLVGGRRHARLDSASVECGKRQSGRMLFDPGDGVSDPARLPRPRLCPGQRHPVHRPQLPTRSRSSARAMALPTNRARGS